VAASAVDAVAIGMAIVTQAPSSAASGDAATGRARFRLALKA
jgi:hypothetical protein